MNQILKYRQLRAIRDYYTEEIERTKKDHSEPACDQILMLTFLFEARTRVEQELTSVDEEIRQIAEDYESEPLFGRGVINNYTLN